ncbi:MAG: ATP-binding protein [Bacteroidetes bacterium]|jgi:signal transduction histidine kinase|nr:ATP-binding protein [Bacteroidota bacterium]MDF1863816.1 ATP-binding protein [Saprospiraceae bacterium]
MKIINILAFTLCFCIGGKLFSQSNTTLVDLLTKLRLAEHDTARIDLHIQLSDFYLSNEVNSEKALDHANLALILSENYNTKRREFLALDKIIRVYYEVKFDLNKALEYLNRAKEIDTTKITIADKALLFGHEGILFRAANDFEKSQRSFFKQLTIYENQNYETGIAKVNFDLAMLFFDQKDFEQALLYYEKALQKYISLNDIKGKIETLNAIGQTYGKLEDYHKNLSHSSDALILARALNDKLQLANININIGFAYLHLEKLVDALNYYNAALSIGDDLQNNRIIANAANELGNIYHKFCNEIEASDYFKQALSAAGKADSKSLKKTIFQSLYNFHEDYGRDSASFIYLKDLVAIKDELYNEERSTQLIHNQIRYETEKKEEEVKLLRENELKNKITIQTQRLQNYVLIIIIILALAASFLLFNAFKRKKAYNKLLELEVKKRTGELADSNAELKTFNTKLEQSNNELERFAYIASHDLKSPLRNVISFLNLIERKLKNTEDKDLKEYLRFATDNARQMYSLIQDVLEFSRVDEKQTLTEEVDLNESLMFVLQNLKDEMQSKNAVVFAKPLPRIEANSVHILQLFQNLIGNGIKYNHNGNPKVILSHRMDSTSHVFSVIDNGIGISEEYHNQIFQMFKRLHTKEEYPGTGIGLAICKKIIHNLGGDIWLESTPGKGATFFFSIPNASIHPN